MNELERRDLSTDVRALIGKDGEPHIVGKSPVFSSLSEDLGGWREIIAPEAFDEVLPTADIRGRYDHDLVLGRTTNGTLALSREADGIAYDITINKNDQEAMAAYARVARGDVNGASFMFMVAEGGDKWEKRPDGMVVCSTWDRSLIPRIRHRPPTHRSGPKFRNSSKSLPLPRQKTPQSGHARRRAAARSN
jgi:HK97 family phage prohead protease